MKIQKIEKTRKSSETTVVWMTHRKSTCVNFMPYNKKHDIESHASFHIKFLYVMAYFIRISIEFGRAIHLFIPKDHIQLLFFIGIQFSDFSLVFIRSKRALTSVATKHYSGNCQGLLPGQAYVCRCCNQTGALLWRLRLVIRTRRYLYNLYNRFPLSVVSSIILSCGAFTSP